MIPRTKRIPAILLVALLAFAAVPALAVAGKGKPGGGGGATAGASVWLVPLYTHEGGPVFGDNVTFGYAYSSNYVWVANKCYQGGTLVYSETRGFYPGYPWGTTYTLGPTGMWTSGSASCTADLITTSRKGTVTLASTSYSVSG